MVLSYFCVNVDVFLKNYWLIYLSTILVDRAQDGHSFRTTKIFSQIDSTPKSTSDEMHERDLEFSPAVSVIKVTLCFLPPLLCTASKLKLYIYFPIILKKINHRSIQRQTGLTTMHTLIPKVILETK